MDYFDWSNFGSGASDLYSKNPGWYSGEMTSPLEQSVQQATDLFKTQFKNLIGRDPTADELGKFQTGPLWSAVSAGNPKLTYGDASGLSNAYIQNSFGPQAAQYQQQQQTDQLGKSEQQLQDIINKTMGNTASALSDPTSKVYQTLAGSMNNMGITPSSGAFQSGVGSTIANSGLNAANAGLEAVGIPGIQGIAQTGTIPYQQSFSSGNTALGNLENQSNFNIQSQLAQMLADQSQPSGFEKDLGYANTASNIFSNLAKAGSSASGGKAFTWICTQLKKEGLLKESQIKVLHWHLYKAFWKRPFKFIGYIVFGKLLVMLANKYNTDWRVWKTEFYDNVMNENDPANAVDLYAEAFWKLYWNVTAKKFLRESHASK